MANFILIHGAWHGGWCWEEIVPALAHLGHRVLAPDLPGMGEDAASGHIATLDEWAMFVAGMASGMEGPTILAGHSRGGMIISRAAELAPHAMKRLVYVTAMMPLPGESMGQIVGEFAPNHKSGLADAVRPTADGRATVCHGREAAIATFYNTSPADRAEAAFARLTAEPTVMLTTPVALTEARYGSVPRTYVRCDEDRALPLALQDHLIARQLCDVASLHADHSPFYSAPAELSDLLHRIA